MKHCFDTDIAQELNVNCAIIYENLKFWCLKNKANNKHFYDGNYWTYNSIKAWKELFPYLGESQIKTALKKLEDNGLISSGNYNKSSYDRTRWYSLIHLVVLANGSGESSQPIPDNKPDNKQDSKNIHTPKDNIGLDILAKDKLSKGLDIGNSDILAKEIDDKGLDISEDKGLDISAKDKQENAKTIGAENISLSVKDKETIAQRKKTADEILISKIDTNTELAKELLADFLSYRREIKKPIKTARGLNAYLNLIKKTLEITKSIDTLREIIELMKINEWQTYKLEYDAVKTIIERHRETNRPRRVV